MKKETSVYTSFHFPLESGASLPEINLTYTTYGTYSPTKKVVWVCHALTANSEVDEWWEGLFGENAFFNDKEYFIICANILGSCYGSTNALSINPITEKPYYHAFPFVTIRDIVNAHILLRKKLNINQIDIVIGASLGGQQALEWSILEPKVILSQILIATNAFHSAWGIAFSEAQRMAIEADATWQTDSETAGLQGMKAARAVALLSYRNAFAYQHFQGETTDKVQNFKAASYQRYQGEKLAKRFNAFSYMTLSKAMDSHNIARNRGGEASKILQTIQAKTLVIGIESDILFPIEEQLFLSEHIPNSDFEIINSVYGHDGFLIETAQLSEHIFAFTSKQLLVKHK